MEPIPGAVARELAGLSDPATLTSSVRFFTEPVRCRGVKMATVHAVA